MAIYYRCGGGGSEDLKIFAEPYNPEKEYVKEDTVEHGKRIYECTVDKTTKGEFDNSKWKLIYMIEAGELAGIEMNDAVGIIAPDYDPKETYNTDDVVLKDGITVKCLEDDVKGPFDQSKWEPTNLVKVGELDSNLGGNQKAEYIRNDSAIKSFTATQNGICKLSLSTNNNAVTLSNNTQNKQAVTQSMGVVMNYGYYHYCELECSKGDTITVSGGSVYQGMIIY